ncbi:hypothetical protein Pyn_11115 [Prunus yedoensis var. nudiflora]|uniref:Uncharacterized protein n=1 Tax=Prunus yedoensis var. nudiflora TaxID=2094558 RepID=A0A314XZX5_PRUYE|nr:hypothetical protein Pyn_11115 [Prunus yedoensis var. nudiflora]
MLLLPSLTDYFSWVVVEVELFCAQKIVTFLKVRKWKRQLPLRLGTLNSEGLKNNHVVRKLEKRQQICTLLKSNLVVVVYWLVSHHDLDSGYADGMGKHWPLSWRLLRE